MITDTTTDQFGLALRESGLYTPDQLRSAEAALAAHGGSPQAAADRLFELRVLTQYQFRKARAGRVQDLLFGPYLILDKIGEGGMGKVYRAVQQRVGRMVALKTIRPHLMANQTVLKRYKREAQAAAALNHPNIVTLYDADEIDGKYFLAMEYVDGIDLSRMVKEFGKPPFRGLDSYQEVCEYVRQVALGLQHAHDHGLVHRDIKPGNLLVYGERALPNTGGKATVKILDMGLVRSIFDGDDVSRTELTRDGTVVGTPDYMAPEQAKNSSTVDPRADLYSLGATLYYLFRGQAVFPDGSPIDKLMRHQLDAPPDIREIRPELPPGVVDVIGRLLRKRPDERIQTAAEVAALLAPYSSTASAVYAPAARAAGPVAVQAVPFAADPNAPSHPDPNGTPPAGSPTVAPSHTAAHSAGSYAPTITLPPGAPKSGATGTVPPPSRRHTGPSTPTPTPVRVAAARPPRSAVKVAPVAAPVAAPSPPPALPTELPAFGDSQRMDGELIRVANRERAAKKSSAQLDDRPAPKFPLVWGLVGGAVTLLLVGVVSAVVLSRGGPDKTQVPPTQPAPPPTDPKPAPTAGVSYPHLPPGNLLLPTDTKAALTFFPKPFFAKFGGKFPRDAKFLDALDSLRDQTAFDVRACDRVTLALPVRPHLPNWGGRPIPPDFLDPYRQPFMLLGEGPFLSDAWVSELEKMKTLRRVTNPFGVGSQNFLIPTGPPPYPGSQPPARYVTGLLGKFAYAVAPHGIGYGYFPLVSDQLAKTKFPMGTSSALVGALPKPDEKNLPLAKFVADGDWVVLPSSPKPKLSDYGVTLLTLTLRPAASGSDFEVVLALTGERAKLAAFLPEYAAVLVALHEEFKPLTDALVKGEQVFGRAAGEDTLKVTAKWTLPAVQKVLDEVVLPGMMHEIGGPSSTRPKGFRPDIRPGVGDDEERPKIRPKLGGIIPGIFGGSKPLEAKPVPVEGKPLDTKPLEAKPVPVEGKLLEGKPVELRPVPELKQAIPSKE